MSIDFSPDDSVDVTPLQIGAEDRLEQESRKLGSATLARERLGIPLKEPSTDEDKPTRTPDAIKAQHIARTTRKPKGISSNEGSDSELDPYWSAQTEPLTAQEKVNHSSHVQETRARLEQARQEQEQTPEEIRQRLTREAEAILRAMRKTILGK